VGVTVPLGVGDAVVDGVGVGVTVPLGVGDAVVDGVGVGVTVPLGVGDAVVDGVGLWLGVGGGVVGEGVGLRLGVGVGVAHEGKVPPYVLLTIPPQDTPLELKFCSKPLTLPPTHLTLKNFIRMLSNGKSGSFGSSRSTVTCTEPTIDEEAPER
jgi:hypothetical protein